MKKYTLLALIGFGLNGCISTQYKLDSNLESNKYTQIIVNDFIHQLRLVYGRGALIKIDGDGDNKYVAKLRSTAIKKGLKVCIDQCPDKVVTFKTEIQSFDDNLIEATLILDKSTYHRLYKKSKKGVIRKFGNPTIYKK